MIVKNAFLYIVNTKTCELNLSYNLRIKTTENNSSTLFKYSKRLLKHFALLTVIAIFAGFSFLKHKKSITKVTTIVIDAGHGGKDPGCSGLNNKEKDVTLAVALKLGMLIEQNLKDVKVIFTRKTDVFVELEERAQIANRNNADLFISIHCNAASTIKTITIKGKKKKKEVINTKPYGSETYVMGIKNEAGKANVVKRENSAMLLEDNYKSKYDGFDPESDESYIMMAMWTSTSIEKSASFAANIQKEYKTKCGRIDKGVRRESLWVLWRTKMPSVLTEIGYLTNEEEEKFITSDKGQKYLACALCRAFRNYKNVIEGTNFKFNDDIENMELLVNENVSKGDTAYMHEIEDYQADNDTLTMTAQEHLKNLHIEANKSFSIGAFNDAETKYTEIKQLQADDKTAKEKLDQIKTIRYNYKKIIENADKLFKEKKYNNSKLLYGDAQITMPKETYPTQRIREIETIFKNERITQIDNEKNILNRISIADDLFSQKKYEEAKDIYFDVYKINGDSSLKLKIDECAEIIEDLYNDIRYNKALNEGDNLFSKMDYTSARRKYQDAILIKPSQKYPKDKIAECEKLSYTPNVDLKLQNDKLFHEAIKYGDNYLLAKKFTEAKEYYEKAQKIRPTDTLPLFKLKSCISYLENDLEVKYKDEIRIADECYLKKDFICAIKYYTIAQSLKPKDDYSDFQINLSKKSLKWQEDNNVVKKLIEAGKLASQKSEIDTSIYYYQKAILFINSATVNKEKFKVIGEDLNKLIAIEKAKKDLVVPLTKQAIEFKVQFTQSETELKTNVGNFSGLKQISFYKAGTFFKYTTGNFNNLQECVLYKQKVIDLGFKDAFIVAFKNGERITIQVAIETLNYKKE